MKHARRALRLCAWAQSAFIHLAAAAFFALADRSGAGSIAARALPPFASSPATSTAAGVFPWWGSWSGYVA